MSVYVIGDLHLSFGTNKPMNIFGENWENHAEKIKNNWNKKVILSLLIKSFKAPVCKAPGKKAILKA